MFAGIATPQISDPPRPFFADRELAELGGIIGFIERHGARALLSVTHVRGEVTPATEKVKAARGPLIELEIKSAHNNPRFLFVACSDVAVFLTAFKKKTQKLRREDIARADERFQTIEDGCE